ncbi:MAG: protein kinase [Isosphaerales bacterium]
MNERDLFIAALQIDGPAERADFLDHACGADNELRKRLDVLLAAHDRPASSLERPIAASLEGVPMGTPDPTTSGFEPPARDGEQTVSYQGETPAPASLIGSIVAGRYKLRQEIGEGGMGSVYLAEQTQPVKRQVALKLIKPGMDSRAVLARFESERQALALMDHPHIAKVFDAGTTEHGRPFFVMELVKGIPLTDYCDQHRLGLPERLALFRQICSAVQHAHQKGIIHRDLKPTNILVESHDGEPVPKVIDFGLAKATSGMQLSEHSLFTAFGSVAGTPLYMAPEQASFNALDIDTRADIYALGVILYELLTGSTPIRRETFRKATIDEMLRLIREVEPPAPSSRISTSDTLPSIAATRQTEPARLSRFVRGDLDWVVMKALAKERNRRYESAIALAQDLERFTNHEPVSAGPPTAAYRVRKFARRHRVALVTVGAFALLLVAATAVSAVLAVWANRERMRAVSAEKSAKEQQGRAQDREKLAIDAVRRYGDVVRETPALKDNPSLSNLRATLLKEPQAFFKLLRDRLQADRETTPESLARLAAASFDLGNLTDEIGDKQDALRAHQESLAIRERLARENPSVTEFQRLLAWSHNNIGLLQKETGRLAEALESLEKARVISERLTSENPSVTEFHNDLGRCYNNIGIVQVHTGRPAEALASFKQARAIFERLARENPSVTEFQNDLAGSHNNIGKLQVGTGRPAEALASYEQAHAIRERLARENPSITHFQRDLGRSYDDIGSLQSQSGRMTEALESREKARVISERLARENPSVTRFQSDLASSHNHNGALQRQTAQPAEALASYEQARAIWERLARENPSVTQFQSDLAESHNNIGDLQHTTGRPAEALASWEQARAIWERQARQHPESPYLASSLGGALHNMAMIDLDQRRFDKARAKLTQAIEWQRKALAVNPSHPTYRQFLVNHLNGLMVAATGLGRADLADQARRELADLAAIDPAKSALDARLAAVLKGKETPKNDAERIGLAYRAYEKALHASSARLYAEALANTPKLTDDRQAQHRYNAACAAALAGSGQAKDDPPPDGAARAKLRQQALGWLKAELAEWAKVQDAGPAEMKAKIAPTLQHWTTDADLAGIRDEKELAKRPKEERVAFQQLWKDVEKLRTKAAASN